MVAHCLGQLIGDPAPHNITELDERIAKAFAAHPEKFLFDCLPGAAAVLAPRLLVAFGPIANGRQCAWRWSATRHRTGTEASGQSDGSTFAGLALSSFVRHFTILVTHRNPSGPRPFTICKSAKARSTTPQSGLGLSNGFASVRLEESTP